MFGELLYWYLGCRQDFATVLFFEQGLCERECTYRGGLSLGLPYAGGYLDSTIVEIRL